MTYATVASEVFPTRRGAGRTVVQGFAAGRLPAGRYAVVEVHYDPTDGTTRVVARNMLLAQCRKTYATLDEAIRAAELLAAQF